MPTKGQQSMEASARRGVLPPNAKVDQVLSIAGWNLMTTDAGLAWGEFWVDGAAMTTYVGEATWETLSYGEAVTADFLTDMRRGSGMKRLVTDAGRFRDAALAEAAAKGTDIPNSKDLLAELTESAEGLLVQAASLNAEVTPGQVEAFALRLAHLRSALELVEVRVAKARSAVDLADLAVLDAISD